MIAHEVRFKCVSWGKAPAPTVPTVLGVPEGDRMKGHSLDRWTHWLMERGFIRSQIGYIDMIASYPTPIPRDTPDELWQELFRARDELQQRLDELERTGP
jgi:hypothetical protein